uniref:Secreted protein n=1 Tax=Ixodes ricinus TaxID=34613 RepID=A0A6B0UE28_IXORI
MLHQPSQLMLTILFCESLVISPTTTDATAPKSEAVAQGLDCRYLKTARSPCRLAATNSMPLSLSASPRHIASCRKLPTNSYSTLSRNETALIFY